MRSCSRASAGRAGPARGLHGSRAPVSRPPRSSTRATRARLARHHSRPRSANSSRHWQPTASARSSRGCSRARWRETLRARARWRQALSSANQQRAAGPWPAGPPGPSWWPSAGRREGAGARTRWICCHAPSRQKSAACTTSSKPLSQRAYCRPKQKRPPSSPSTRSGAHDGSRCRQRSDSSARRGSLACGTPGFHQSWAGSLLRSAGGMRLGLASARWSTRLWLSSQAGAVCWRLRRSTAQPRTRAIWSCSYASATSSSRHAGSRLCSPATSAAATP
mmetsp:Transcript_47175/g.110130  ORF Transcript_47175/g.110130 Transcript_47175/m.110130 type:complete len:278 (-) Transcript_47175:1189-2022(-)